jgi:hypothetical protein
VGIEPTADRECGNIELLEVFRREQDPLPVVIRGVVRQKRAIERHVAAEQLVDVNQRPVF